MTTIIQGSPEWFSARLGKVTASRISDVIARTKTGWGASRANYAAQLIAERLTGTVVEGYTNGAMQWGTATEPAARLAYAETVIEPVTEVGFIDHPYLAMTGASPDGLVGDVGVLEAKCPLTATHIDTLLSGTVPAKYADAQIQWQLACTGRTWCDFVSFDPRLPKEMQLFVKRIYRDDKKIAELEGLVIDFLAEIDHKEAELRRRYLDTARPVFGRAQEYAA